MTALEYNDNHENIRSSLLLHCIGDKAREVYHTLTFVEGEQLKYDNENVKWRL